jgi:hypothetical protein
MKKLIILGILLVGTLSPSAQKNLTIQDDITVLTSDSLEGRYVGSAGEKKAAAYLAKRMEQIGLAPKGVDGYYQYFSFRPHPAVQRIQDGDSVRYGTGLVKEVTGRNVVGYWDRGYAHTVVIGAHYDHLGWGDENSLWSGSPGLHRGADDNASGVAALLSIATQLKAEEMVDNGKALGEVNYLFIAFSGEEKGLYGSNYFCKNPTVPVESMCFMINMDMVGRLKADRSLAISGIGTAKNWKKILVQKNKKQPRAFQLVLDESGVGPSDHTSFYNTKIPAIHFFTGQHEQYHKPTDVKELINYAGLEDLTAYIEDVICAGATKLPFSFTPTQEKKQAQAADFKVTLGVMPDYLYSGDGLKLDGVKEGKPAQKGGLQQGDIIIQMGKYPIKDIYAYMEALSHFAPGEKTEVVVLRNNEKLKKEVEF